jgi:hypothetical protein
MLFIYSDEAISFLKHPAFNFNLKSKFIITQYPTDPRDELHLSE